MSVCQHGLQLPRRRRQEGLPTGIALLLAQGQRVQTTRPTGSRSSPGTHTTERVNQRIAFSITVAGGLIRSTLRRAVGNRVISAVGGGGGSGWGE